MLRIKKAVFGELSKHQLPEKEVRGVRCIPTKEKRKKKGRQVSERESLIPSGKGEAVQDGLHLHVVPSGGSGKGEKKGNDSTEKGGTGLFACLVGGRWFLVEIGSTVNKQSKGGLDREKDPTKKEKSTTKKKVQEMLRQREAVKAIQREARQEILTTEEEGRDHGRWNLKFPNEDCLWQK